MNEPNLVLCHLDVTQPHPFLRLWERWGHGDGGDEWLHPPPPPRLGWDQHPPRTFGDLWRRRAWGDLPRPPPGWRVPFAADPAESARAFETRRRETLHEKAAHGVSDPPLDVGSARRGSQRVSSPRVLGGDPARRPPAANETEPTPEDEGHGASEGDAGYQGYQASELAAELGVAADAKPMDTPLERKRAAVQATLQRKLREAEAGAAAAASARDDAEAEA